MIKAQQLTRNYGSFIAVDAISFEIAHGEIVGLLGHNGAGKTTIMKMLTGFLEPTAGTIQINGLDIAEQRVEAQQKIGYLPENCPLYPEMTVIDYLDYAARLRGIEEPARTDAIRGAIAKTELEEKAAHSINTLSRGYKQRVGVAQAILHNPEILILDEPTNGLDPSQIHHMRELIISLREHSTIILSTHIMQEVEAVCDRVLIIHSGQLALDAKLEALRRSGRILLSVDADLTAVQHCMQGLDGVRQVDLLRANGTQRHYALALDESAEDGVALVPNIAKTALDHGFSLYALHPEKRDLETVFREINQ